MRQVFTPREYQYDMRDFMIEHKRCGLFAGMGLGKTTSVLTTLDEMFLAGVETKPALVLAPKRVAQSTWPNEAAKWNHLHALDVVSIVGNEAERRAALRKVGGSTAVFTINYENIPWLLEVMEGQFPFGTVIADESTKLKGFRMKQGGRRASYLGRIAHSKATRWINLTGTPAPNGLQDLWGQCWFLDSGVRLGREYDAFKARWFHAEGPYNQIAANANAQKEIEEKLKDICLSIDAKDYFDLEEPIRNYIYVDLPPKARELYRQMEREFFIEIEGRGIEAFNSAAKSQKLLQLASGAVYLDRDVYDDAQPKAKEWKEVHDVKMQALESVYSEAAGMPLLVAYHFKSDLARIRNAFSFARPFDDNPATEREWNSGKISMMPIHPASGGHGSNLQDGGNIICHLSHWWNNELLQQVNERIGPVRQMQGGYKRPVFEHYIIARDTIEEDVIERRKNKTTIEEAFRQAMKKRKV